MSLKDLFAKKKQTIEEKRAHHRYDCSIKVDFYYFEGNPDQFDRKTATPLKGRGFILDISASGAFIVTNTRLPIFAPVVILKNDTTIFADISGKIVRTGLLQNNPSELARKYSSNDTKGDSYLAINFDQLLDNPEKFQNVVD